MKKKEPKASVKTTNAILIFILLITVSGLLGLLYFSYTNLISSVNASRDAISKLQQENAPIANTDATAAQNANLADIPTIYPSLAVEHNDAQTVMTRDVNKYAKLSNIQISNTTFPRPSQEQNTNTSSFSLITISSNRPTSMRSILQFIKLIENNLPAMHVTEISLESSGNDAIIKSITIGVALK